MTDEEKSMAEAQALLSGLIAQMRMQYGLAMQDAGLGDLQIAVVHLKAAHAMEVWAQSNF